MTAISNRLRRRIVERAQNRCEYCLTPQQISAGQMQVDHIVPTSKGGNSESDNLCLTCAWCNSYKSNKRVTIDPSTQESVSLFNPRLHSWWEHFRWDDEGVRIIGLTSIGRATVIALRLNNEFVLPARRNWVLAGWYPPAVGEG